jgi:hypothetical protein
MVIRWNLEAPECHTKPGFQRTLMCHPTMKMMLCQRNGWSFACRRQGTHLPAYERNLWDASGKPISAAQFVQNLPGKLPELFRDGDHAVSGASLITRAALVAGLAERGFDGEALASVRKTIDAEDCDLRTS